MNNEFNLLVIILGFSSVWCLVLYIASKRSGWRTISDKYRWEGPISGLELFQRRKRPLRILSINGLGGGESSVRVYVNPTGLFLAPKLMFKPFHPNLFIPWGDIKDERAEKSVLGFKITSIRLNLIGTDGSYIEFSEDNALKLKEASQGGWNSKTV